MTIAEPTTDRVQRLFDEQVRRDPFGHRVQTACAMVYAFLLAWPTSVVEFAPLALYICFAVRPQRQWQLVVTLLRTPYLWWSVALVAWTLASRLWTPDPRAWLEEFGQFRWLVPVLAVWSVMDRRNHLIGAFLAGVACAQLSQVAHGLGVAFDVPALRWSRLPDRNSGWWDPVVGGTILVAALALYLPALLAGGAAPSSATEPGPARATRHQSILARAPRWLGAAGAASVLLSILATGTRGAYLAAAAITAIAVALAARRRLHARRPAPRATRAMRAMLVPVLAGATLLAGAGWYLAGPSVSRRIQQGVTEVREALVSGRYASDTGERLRLARTAVLAIRDHPLLGVGAGGFRAYDDALQRADGIDPMVGPRHGHAHNALLHAGATLGLPGMLLTAIVMALAIRSGFARPRAAPPPPAPAPLGFATGPAFALVALALVSAFDTIQVNQQTAAVLGFLLILCLPNRPATPGDPVPPPAGAPGAPPAPGVPRTAGAP